jgi:8-oxo-dGTP pyrophosphatase MutT (NUDIX family)
MSFMDHVRACNAYRPEQFVPLLQGGRRIGRLRRDNAELLRRFPGLFAVAADGVAIRGEHDYAGLTRAIDDVVEALVAEGRVDKWRHEYFAVAPRRGDAPVCEIDRGAVAFFGAKSYGVHLNGLRRDDDGLKLWVGRRAPDKKVAPNQLDNIVAGGIGSGHGVVETLAKEAGEEAAIPRELIAKARPVGAASYRMETKLGLRDDVLFIYDLELPADFVPRNTDGEIAEFMLMPADAVIRRVRDTAEFKFNVNLVLIDFAIRHGLLGPDDPDYVELCAGLNRPSD